MKYIIKIKRRKNAASESYWQTFEYESDKGSSAAQALKDINGRVPIKTADGEETDKIAWECGCMVRKCGACAMKINGVPCLACSFFFKDLKDNVVTIEPLSKFPIVKDLVVDRHIIFKNTKKLGIWLENKANSDKKTHSQRYASAKCLMCGCCLEVCPNFGVGEYMGAVASVNAFRILNQETEKDHIKEIKKEYLKNFYSACGKSLSCHDVCPAGINVEELMVRVNRNAVWGLR